VFPPVVKEAPKPKPKASLSQDIQKPQETANLDKKSQKQSEDILSSPKLSLELSSSQETKVKESPKKEKSLQKQESPKQSSQEPTKPITSNGELKNLFEGCNVYLYGDVLNRREVKRYLIAHNADVVEELDAKEITHIVTDRTYWDQNLKDKRGNVKIVRSSWVWSSVNGDGRAREREHFMK
jgi:hypothetical protein